METVLTHPKKLKEMMEAGMRGEVQEGGMTEEELKGMLDEVNASPKESPIEQKKTRYSLRGEGGSGEKPKLQIGEREALTKRGRGRNKGKGKKEEEGEEKKEEEGKLSSPELMEVEGKDENADAFEPVSALPGDEMEVEEMAGGDHHAHQGDTSVPPASTTEGDKTTQGAIDELRRYCEDQFASITAVLVPLQNRIERLERQVSVRVLPGGAGSPPPKRAREARASSGEGGWQFMDETESRPQTADIIQPEKIADFLKSNPRFITLSPVRVEKLKALQRTMGLEPVKLELKTSEWTKEGIYTALVVAHGGK